MRFFLKRELVYEALTLSIRGYEVKMDELNAIPNDEFDEDDGLSREVCYEGLRDLYYIREQLNRRFSEVLIM